MSKHSVTIRGLRVVTTCWSWAWSNCTSPSKWVGLGSPLAASSVYGDLTCSVHTVNNLCMFNCQCHFYLCNRGPYVRLAFVPNMLSSWNKDIIIIIILCTVCICSSYLVSCFLITHLTQSWFVAFFDFRNCEGWSYRLAALVNRSKSIIHLLFINSISSAVRMNVYLTMQHDADACIYDNMKL